MKEWMKIGNCLSELFFPRLCPVCGRRLCTAERAVCTGCLGELPRTGYHRQALNPCEETFYGRINPRRFGRATSYFYYERENPCKHILWRLKYQNQPEVGYEMGRIMAKELMADAFFVGIDLLLPVPLAKEKQRQRGYNQCDYIAAGISDVTGIPVARNSVERIVNNESQTHKSRAERQENVEGIFEARDTLQLEGKHVLLIDDVLTSGATLISCATALQAVPGIRFSFLTMACARL